MPSEVVSKRKRHKFINALVTFINKYRSGSDLSRWANMREFSTRWDSRTERIAALIPEKANVLEFGAGRLVLKKHLPTGCSYTPSDIVDRGEGTIVLDLNTDELPDFDKSLNVAVFSGVLEYINDVPQLITHLSETIPTIVTSYATTDLSPKTIKRRQSGWVNDYSTKEFETIFTRLGYQIDHYERWHRQEIYRFTRSTPAE